MMPEKGVPGAMPVEASAWRDDAPILILDRRCTAGSCETREQGRQQPDTDRKLAGRHVGAIVYSMT